ncbi:flavin reductase (DIM6/NTAB) family NADH-FMN oxidoreductase RutF [Glaciihabitans tibetensis]|uniref:Flavin reductase (DIM6/NTAB) family NADH-FMN oxidoreductase RutF n=1 Tax=Glaciihabitans tibetensis TaxID=1266600 RepID=A0A2T0VJW8_9MICO|nr:flavin reductase family protein [Glaciihabitans tibetensis]PRY70526.1 flavin reductase (DIM6/NTAB) family NADH-FMN oxidoreductase RutF [Glaciihabitans tibetensis]
MTETVSAAISGIDDPGVLRRGFTLYPRGVMAVASLIDGEPVGLAVSAFVSVSLEPPLMLICIDAQSRTWPVLRTAGGIGVSVIAEDQAWLGRQLASRRTDRFAGTEFDASESGALLLAGSTARFDCTIESESVAGDHLMVLLRVTAMEGSPEVMPLLWHDSEFRRVHEL